MVISDLSVLEVVQENNVVGGFNFGPSLATQDKFNLNIDQKVKSAVQITGNQAGAEADSLALGANTVTTTVTNTTVNQGVGSSSSSTSLAATVGSSYKAW